MSLARRFCCLACVILLALADSANAGEVEDRRFLRDLLSTDTIPIESFTQSFLEAVPETKLRVALRPFRQNYGKVRRVSLDGERYVVWTESHKIPVTLRRNLAGKIHTFFFHTPARLVANLKADLAPIEKLPGKIAYLITKNGKELAASGENAPLAVGSAFKLAVLAALKSRVDQGKAKWADVIRLQSKHKSLPSGILQDMSAGAPLTLHSAAALVIAQSDNTATDLLIDYLGRKEVEKIAGIAPLLTTA